MRVEKSINALRTQASARTAARGQVAYIESLASMSPGPGLSLSF